MCDVVNPSASQDEINEVLEGGQGHSVFADKILVKQEKERYIYLF